MVSSTFSTSSEGSIEVDAIESLASSSGVGHDDWVADERIDPPSFRPHIAGVDDSFAVTFDQKAHGTDTVIGIEQRHSDLPAWRKFDCRGRLQWYSLQESAEVAICLPPTLQDSLGKIHAMRVLLQLEQDITSGWRAVDEELIQAVQAGEMVAVHMTEEVGERWAVGSVQ